MAESEMTKRVYMSMIGAVGTRRRPPVKLESRERKGRSTNPCGAFKKRHQIIDRQIIICSFLK